MQNEEKCQSCSIEMQNEKRCQSCGMEMNGEVNYGKNTDGTSSTDYCEYCFENGAFASPDETMEQMLESCIPYLVDENISEATAREMLEETLPRLKRWSA